MSGLLCIIDRQPDLRQLIPVSIATDVGTEFRYEAVLASQQILVVICRAYTGGTVCFSIVSSNGPVLKEASSLPVHASYTAIRG